MEYLSSDIRGGCSKEDVEHLLQKLNIGETPLLDLDTAQELGFEAIKAAIERGR